MAGTGVGKYSTTAGNNTDTQTVNFSEGMAPSNVNNAARETMANIRSMYNQIGEGFYEFGDGDGTYTVARSDSDTITITATAAREPPNDNEPVSPINILAGGALNHKKPKQEPIIAPQKIETSPVPSM